MINEKAAEIVRRLEDLYPSADCALVYDGEPWKLLVMARLSAQCTDKRVNIVSEALFLRYPTMVDLADADVTEVEGIVKSCGLYKVKARNIIDECKMIIDRYGGELPSDMDSLLTLPGVGRKIANLIIGDVFHAPAIVTDTHCIRITGRLGLAAGKDPHKIEMRLAQLIPPEKQSEFCHRLVWFGRDVCTARSPKCNTCTLADLCEDAETRGRGSF
jgi:endonuclease-3